VAEFWDRVETILSDGSDRSLSVETVLALKYNPRANIAPHTRIIPLACALWTIHSTRIQSLYGRDTTHTTLGMERVWKHAVAEILLAKKQTAREKGSVEEFVAVWGWVADAIGHPIATETPTIG
jgi:hypothetical protein